MSDPYVYPHTDILKNTFGIKKKTDLEEMEADYTSMRLKEITDNPLKGNYDFQHFCEFHKWIFQDIFDWAGSPRVIEIEKPEPALGGLSIEYAEVKNIEKNATAILDKMNNTDWNKLDLDGKAELFSKFMAAIWKVHCFREGNTRTVITFCHQFAESKGFSLDRELLGNNAAYVRNSLVAASANFTDLGDKSKPEYLIRIVKDSLKRGLEDRPSIKGKLEECKSKSVEKGKSYNKAAAVDTER